MDKLFYPNFIEDYMLRINVIDENTGEIRQFNVENFEKTIRKVKYLKSKMDTSNNNFCYDIENWKECEYFLKTFYDFDSFKKALKELTK